MVQNRVPPVDTHIAVGGDRRGRRPELHPILDVKPWPRVMLRNPLLILTALLLGALLAFAYSYAPLHRAKDWKIGYLEERLESRNEQVRVLEQQFGEAQSSLDGTPSDGEISALRTRLDEATKLAESNKKEVDKVEGKLASMTRSRDSWKSRHGAAMKELEAQSVAAAAPAPATPAPTGTGAPTAPTGDPVPASPAPTKPAPSGSDPNPEN